MISALTWNKDEGRCTLIWRQRRPLRGDGIGRARSPPARRCAPRSARILTFPRRRMLAHGLFNLERAVGRSSGCVPRGVQRGTTRRNSRSIPTSCNEAGRRAGRALAPVATSTERVTIGRPLNLNRHRQLHRLRSGQLLFLGSTCGLDSASAIPMPTPRYDGRAAAGSAMMSTAARGDAGLRRLPETFVPDDAGLTFAFKEGRRAHSRLSGRRSDTEGGRQDKSAGMKVDRNRLCPEGATRGAGCGILRPPAVIQHCRHFSRGTRS